MSPSEKKPTSTRLATAGPGALSAVLLIGAVAFGATSLRPAVEDQAAEPAKAAPAESLTTPEFGAIVAGVRRNEFTQDPTPQQPRKAEAPKAEPMAKPEVMPKPKPEVTEATNKEPKPAEQTKQEPTAKPKPAPIETKKPAPVGHRPRRR